MAIQSSQQRMNVEDFFEFSHTHPEERYEYIQQGVRLLADLTQEERDKAN